MPLKKKTKRVISVVSILIIVASVIVWAFILSREKEKVPIKSDPIEEREDPCLFEKHIIEQLRDDQRTAIERNLTNALERVDILELEILKMQGQIQRLEALNRQEGKTPTPQPIIKKKVVPPVDDNPF